MYLSQDTLENIERDDQDERCNIEPAYRTLPNQLACLFVNGGEHCRSDAFWELVILLEPTEYRIHDNQIYDEVNQVYQSRFSMKFFLRLP